ncbi:MAG: hypothetical protein A3J35_01550 [Gammaproteobacteria bacterium RIFCSPLOWO2_02_FULL_52_10]|nr:MAG: hypothetical protein A3J35_01550 [Gammaproteobacteria bacterium RIFCSPLOWO2_02_FULL_52_10]OGT83844.1 MAG: hypothetical protein A3G96_05915 [Gammaproteobacteria bacterium RIFCSPLOWO2_12_FULL_52_10]
MNNNSSTAANLSGNTPNNQRQYEVSKKDLPLHCPMPGMSLWNSHPRVYLPVEATGEARCPYCGAEFILR